MVEDGDGAEASGTDLESETAEIHPAKSCPPSKVPQSLPLLLVRTLTNDDAHKCRCQICEPDLPEKLLEKVRQEKGEEVKEEVKEKLWHIPRL